MERHVPEQHPVEWTDEKIARVWDFYSGRLEGLYFAQAAGDHVVTLLRREVPLRDARLLDYGCGRGFLFEHLQRRSPGTRYVGLDFSENSVARCRERFAGRPGFEDAVHAARLPSRLADSSFDVAVGLEIIEHLDDARLHEAVAEMRRCLKPGGSLVLTTPNREDLADSTMICPDCACVFHRWQHVRSWSAETLRDALAPHGFRDVRLIETDFVSWPHRLKRRAQRALRGGRPANLAYVGVKPAA